MKQKSKLLFILRLSLFLGQIKGAKILLVHEGTEGDLTNSFETTLNSASSNAVTVVKYQINHDDDDDTTEFCAALEAEDLSFVVDLSWSGWDAVQELAAMNGIPYLHIEASNKPFVMAVDKFLFDRKAIDAALLFENENELDQSLYHIIGNYNLRVLVVSREESDPFARMANLRPVPSAFVAFGTTQELTQVINEAKNKNLIRRDSRWNFVAEDFDAGNLVTSGIDVSVTVVSMPAQVCCGLTGTPSADNPSICLLNCGSGVKPKQIIVKNAAQVVSGAALDIVPSTFSCVNANPTNASRTEFKTKFKANMPSGTKYIFDEPTDSYTYPIELDFTLAGKTNNGPTQMATWSGSNGVSFTTEFKDKPIPRFFRVGMTVAIPWLYEKKNDKGEIIKDKDGKIMYEGYCMDLLKKIAEELQFEFEVVITPEDRPGLIYGRKLENGSWTGMIKDLAKGDTDIIVADLTMTSEREEIIDFVSPYFDQAGISIVLRKKLREQTLFKFLSVLRPEVWLGIVGAVVVTAILIWLLDRYSPYSARNNKAAYPYPCRDFTLKESFWFALTSLTPQGGGEAPKALSGRVLVAAYWLFVVLMLATFTANLAAFLTVERMQTTVQSLEELARQSRINYTVVQNTSYMEYFENMASAEEELYHKWKELTLNSSGNPSKYRVWDYPIREQYTQILEVIMETEPVKSTQEGFENVLANNDGEYAFIHDAARIRYEVYNNCNLTEVGEPFAEQPYALAVQQGSHLQEELSRVILQLQKDRYFENLQSQYWNNTNQNDCPVLDDSEGITLKSLGGVFIATLIGLGLALITLAVEVVMQKKRESNKVRNMKKDSDLTLGPKDDKDDYVHTIRGRGLTTISSAD